MSRRSLMRAAGVLGICLVCAFFFVPFSKVRLGLDLKGGVHYELEVQGREALAMDLEETRALLQDQFLEKGYPDAGVFLEEGALRIQGVPAPTVAVVLAKAPGYALQERQGTQVLIQKPEHQRALKKAANDRALQIIETRVNQFGVVEPEITQGGAEGNRIIVELPGVEEGDRDRIKRLLSTPGRLELRMLAKADRSYFPTKEDALAHFGGEVPHGLELFPEPEPEPQAGPQGLKAKGPQAPGPGAVRRWVLLEQRTQFDGTAITDARAAESEVGLHEVHFTLNQAGAEANARVTGLAAEEGRLFAFVLDRKVISVLSAQEKMRVAGNERIQLGMQFVGGTEMTVRFLAPVEAGEVRAALAKGGFPEATVVAYEHAEPGLREFSIKVKPQKQGDAAQQSSRVKEALKAMDADEAARPALNLEGSNALADRLAAVNPLGLKEGEQATRAAYEGYAGQVTGRRERLPAGLYRSFAELPEDLPAAVRGQLERDYRPGKIGILKDESFSASISGEWTRKTLAAVAWAMGAILLYVVFRFTTAFAVGGIIALVHDMLMALALFAVLGYEFNVPVVASFLTLMGYSMADTIVVFDRIRENNHKPEYRRAPFTQIINDSINQTLSRTVLTSLSVLFVSVCLWLWGGPALRDLAFPLVVGVLTGTYSSIYIASPVVAWWQRFAPGRDPLAAS